ncbi:MAG: DJ-1/PfpI/YhbO family deglycase/protease [Phycisphaeraceae bacterium]
MTPPRMIALAFAACFLLVSAHSQAFAAEADAKKAAPAKDKSASSDTGSDALAGKKVAMLLAERFNSAEGVVSKRYVEKHGGEVIVIGIEPGDVTAYDRDVSIEVQKKVEDVEVKDFHALIIPGGYAPMELRKHEPSVKFSKRFMESGKPVAAICHGPLVLATAGKLEGKTLTCFGGVSDEITDAGGEFVNKPVVVDGNLITSRLPKDLDAFTQAIHEALVKEDAADSKHEQ